MAGILLFSSVLFCSVLFPSTRLARFTRSPVVGSPVGKISELPRPHQWPSPHKSLGPVNPLTIDAVPGLLGVHSSAAFSPVVFENVLIGHKNAVEDGVPGGQNDPTRI